MFTDFYDRGNILNLYDEWCPEKSPPPSPLNLRMEYGTYRLLVYNGLITVRLMILDCRIAYATCVIYIESGNSVTTSAESTAASFKFLPKGGFSFQPLAGLF